MRFIQNLLTISLAAAPVFAAPVAEPENAVSSTTDEAKPTKVLDARATYVTCRPKENKSSTKTFKVDVDKAKEQMHVAGLTEGDSGDPHHYAGHDGFTWGVEACDNKKNQLWEYPIFWVGYKYQAWEKNTKTKKQPSKTPIRVVYAEVDGSETYCGDMIHSKVTDEYKGEDYFSQCT